MGLMALRDKKTYTDKTKLNPAAPDDIRAVDQRLKKYINTVQFLAQTDHFMSLDLSVSSRAAEFHLVLSVYGFYSLKAVGPID